MSAAYFSSDNDHEAAERLREQATELQESIVPDVYTPELFIPWKKIEDNLARTAEARVALQELVDEDRITADDLAEWLSKPRSLYIARTLVAAPQVVGFADGRTLPEIVPTRKSGRLRLASLLIDLGMPRIVPRGSSVTDLVRLGEIGLDARRRGFRRRDEASLQSNKLVQDALNRANMLLKVKLRLAPSTDWPTSLRGRASAVVATDDGPVAAIVDVFQSASGGRQQRDLAYTYPALQKELEDARLSLILVLDGRGVREAPRSVIAGLISRVASCMSRSQAVRGDLTEALVRAVRNREKPSQRRLALEVLIESALSVGSSVSTDQLPGASSDALLALGSYVAEHNELDLELNVGKQELSWRRPNRVRKAQSLISNYDPELAIDILVELLGATQTQPLPETDPIAGCFGTIDDEILPQRLLIAAAPAESQFSNVDLIRVVGRLSRQRDLEGGGVALLCLPATPPSGVQPSITTRSLVSATSVVTLEPRVLERIVISKKPRDALMAEVLEQADLTKTNPFTVMGATGRRMFYGRSEEIALLQHTLLTNSAAVLGGRRIGKTSLLLNTRQRLDQEGHRVWYADCQAVGSWSTFARYVGRQWGVDLNEEFSSAVVVELIDLLRARSTKKAPVIIMLDEIDNLLRWDREHAHPDGMPEPLFRTFRALSQEGRAQFVFSGERLIAHVLWDPASPHWNFCRAVPIRQLQRHDATDLIYQPLRALGVKFVDPSRFLESAWLATDGHPQLVQQLGEALVNGLNERSSRSRSMLDLQDLRRVTEESSYRRHYVSTYWGQSTVYEQLLSVLICEGASSVEELSLELRALDCGGSLADVRNALRILDLYGIIDFDRDGIQWRASNFAYSLGALGGSELVKSDLASALRRS